MTRPLSVFCFAVVLVLAGCGSTGEGGGRSMNPDVLTYSEIEASGRVFVDAYEIVRHFRPGWLIKRGTVSFSRGSDTIDYIAVFADRQRLGDLEALRSIPAQTVGEMEFFDASRSQTLAPGGLPHGGIVVRTRAR